MPYRLSLALATLIFCSSAFAQEKPAAEKASPLKSDQQKDGYAIGMDIGEGIVAQGLDLDVEMLIRGLRDTIGKEDTVLTKEQKNAQMQSFRTRMMAKAREKQEAAAREKFADVIKQGKDFLAANKAKAGVKTTESGLQYKVIKSGKGATPTKADSVVAHYRGKLLDGTEFDSSYKRGEPTEFPVTGVIKGWTEALQLMKAGDKWELYIPSDLAYGANGAGAKIKPFSTLVFEIELVDVKKKAPR